MRYAGGVVNLKKGKPMTNDPFPNGVITFSESVKFEILAMFKIFPDKDGYLTHNGVRIQTPEGEDIRGEEFAGMWTHPKTGKTIYIKNDIPHLIELMDAMKDERS